MIVVRDGRVVHHEIDPALEAKGVRVCDIATCDDDDVAQASVGRASARREDAFTVLHDAFLAGGAFVYVPDGVVVEDPIVVLHWCEGDGDASFPHTLVVLGERAEATVLDRFGSPDTDHLVDAVVELLVGDAAHLRYLVGAGARAADVARSRFQRAHVGRDATLRVVGGRARRRLRPAAQRVAARPARAPRAISSRSTSATASRCSTSARCRTTTRRTRAATCCSRARSKTTPARCTRGWSACAKPRRSRTRTQTNRNLVLTEGASAESIPNLEIEANDVRCSHASTVGPIDDDQLYYLESRGVPPDEAERLIVLGFFDDVFDRLPVSALTRRLRSTVVEKLEHRGATRRWLSPCGVAAVDEHRAGHRAPLRRRRSSHRARAHR